MYCKSSWTILSIIKEAHIQICYQKCTPTSARHILLQYPFPWGRLWIILSSNELLDHRKGLDTNGIEWSADIFTWWTSSRLTPTERYPRTTSHPSYKYEHVCFTNHNRTNALSYMKWNITNRIANIENTNNILNCFSLYRIIRNNIKDKFPLFAAYLVKRIFLNLAGLHPSKKALNPGEIDVWHKYQFGETLWPKPPFVTGSLGTIDCWDTTRTTYDCRHSDSMSTNLHV